MSRLFLLRPQVAAVRDASLAAVHVAEPQGSLGFVASSGGKCLAYLACPYIPASQPSPPYVAVCDGINSTTSKAFRSVWPD